MRRASVTKVRGEGKWEGQTHAAAKAGGGRRVGLVEDLSHREERAQGRQSFSSAIGFRFLLA